MTNKLPTRRNRRARTQGNRPVKDNSIYAVTVIIDGYYVGQSMPLYYRRRLAEGGTYTGLASEVRA